MTVRKVAIVIHEGVQALDVAGPADALHGANAYLPAAERYETVLVAGHRCPLRASNGMQLVADLSFDDAVGDFDMLLVAGGPAMPDAPPDPALTAWLRKAPQIARLYGSVCTGAFALGYAGLLDQRRAATHWQHAGKLSRRFPEARVEPDAIHIRDERLMTSAGVTAGIDLALAVIGENHGHGLALAVAKRLVMVAQRQGGQSQFSPYLTAPSDPDSPVARVQALVMGNIGQRHTLQSLAAAACMSTRNLTRYFMQEAGITPYAFVQQARVDAARKMLEAGDQPLKSVAFSCGFGTVDRMRIVFNERLGVTPAQYRASFHRRIGHRPSAFATPPP
ncbi:AraC family transcriptional regulator [Bordetella sp. H567]|uniref:GlxA family transcriptional regulator n=1 Tax=Bordetella sp. H567 TaxID=1697043 RepID=UPI00081D0822|nr:DJ-1/PfpI family protein [Bordetella sp. H567]AOB29927.1 AraC family transcriptional regulator [Bordetella sp. H567]